MSKMLRAIGMRGHGAEVAGLDREKAEEQAWQEVDKSKVREMLEQMNEWNREANAEGVALHEFVNANKIIPRDLATRLASGRKFFDPEMLGDKLKGENASSPQRAAAPKPKQDPAKLNAWKSASESEKRRLKTSPDMASAIAAAMGISANPAETKAESSPSAAEQRAPQRASIDGLTRQAESKLRNELEGVFGIANPEHQNQLGGMIADVWKNLARETEERNDALRQLTGHFGKGLGATVANIRKGVDTSKIAGFDELVDHAVSEYPHLVSRIAGDSDTGSHEEALAEAIRAGIQKVPQPWSQQVFDRVEQLAGPSVFDPQAMEVDQALAGVQEDEPIPFSAKSDFARAVARYWAQAESLLHS